MDVAMLTQMQTTNLTKCLTKNINRQSFSSFAVDVSSKLNLCHTQNPSFKKYSFLIFFSPSNDGFNQYLRRMNNVGQKRSVILFDCIIFLVLTIHLFQVQATYSYARNGIYSNNRKLTRFTTVRNLPEKKFIVDSTIYPYNDVLRDGDISSFLNNKLYDSDYKYPNGLLEPNAKESKAAPGNVSLGCQPWLPDSASSFADTALNPDSVDWWLAIKFPRSYEIAYIDSDILANCSASHGNLRTEEASRSSFSSSLKHCWRVGIDVNANNSPTRRTLSQIFDNYPISSAPPLKSPFFPPSSSSQSSSSSRSSSSSTANTSDATEMAGYVLYNDEDPFRHEFWNRAHSKGVLGFRSHGGFWLTHSAPSFPGLPYTRDFGAVQPSQAVYGQHFFCTSLRRLDLLKVVKGLVTMRPHAYNGSIPGPKLLQLYFPVVKLFEGLLPGKAGQHLEWGEKGGEGGEQKERNEGERARPSATTSPTRDWIPRRFIFSRSQPFQKKTKLLPPHHQPPPSPQGHRFPPLSPFSPPLSPFLPPLSPPPPPISPPPPPSPSHRAIVSIESFQTRSGLVVTHVSKSAVLKVKIHEQIIEPLLGVGMWWETWRIGPSAFPSFCPFPHPIPGRAMVASLSAENDTSTLFPSLNIEQLRVRGLNVSKDHSTLENWKLESDETSRKKGANIGGDPLNKESNTLDLGSSKPDTSMLQSRVIVDSLRDHSKWGISTNPLLPYVCFGDLNRQKSQVFRGGGYACLAHKPLWDLLHGSLLSADSC